MAISEQTEEVLELIWEAMEAEAEATAELNEEYLNRNMSLARVWGAFHPCPSSSIRRWG